MKWIHNHKAIYQPRYAGIILDDDNDKRNSVLSKLYNNNQIESNQKITNCDFFRGWDINFRFNHNNKKIELQWNTDNNIYLLESGVRSKSENGKDICFYMNTIIADSSEKLVDWMKNFCE